MKKLLLVAILAGLFITPNVFADNVISLGGTWQQWDTTSLNNNGAPFWDNTSNDLSRVQTNIGYYMTKTGDFTGGNGPGFSYDFWGNTYTKPPGESGGGPGYFWFQNNGTPITATFKLALAGNADNVFGYYDNTGYHIIFGAGPHNPGDQVTFTPIGTTYGFYFIGVGNKMFDTGNEDDDPNSYQHFAMFHEGDNTYWLGMEDTSSGDGSDKDNNDMIVRLAPVPEPATMLLLGTGLLGIWVYGRRRFRK